MTDHRHEFGLASLEGGACRRQQPVWQLQVAQLPLVWNWKKNTVYYLV